MLCLANDEIRRFAEFISNPDIPEVELYVIPGYDVIETPDGGVGFAVYNPEQKRILVPEGITEEDKERVLFSIAHEYFHHIEYTHGTEPDEEKAEEFAQRIVEDFQNAKRTSSTRMG